MKNVFLGFGITICSIIAIVIVMTLWGINIRQNELDNAVNGALKETIENQFDSKTYSINSNDELVADFIEALLIQVNSDSTVSVNILDVDYKKGLLSVEVIEKYKHPIGTEGEVSVKRTAIMDQYTVDIK